jgi:hypothetical protein
MSLEWPFILVKIAHVILFKIAHVQKFIQTPSAQRNRFLVGVIMRSSLCHDVPQRCFSGDAPEADMAHRRVDRLRMTRGRPVAAAIVWRA